METTTTTANRNEPHDLRNSDLREERMARMTPELWAVYLASQSAARKPA